MLWAYSRQCSVASTVVVVTFVVVTYTMAGKVAINVVHQVNENYKIVCQFVLPRNKLIIIIYNGTYYCPTIILSDILIIEIINNNIIINKAK